MFENLALLRTASLMGRHAAARQDVVARNLANADTPGYRAQALGAFARTMDEGTMRASRPGHLTAREAAHRPAFRDSDPAPNGNTVSIETEMVEAADVEREHQRSLTIYRHALTVLRTVTAGR